MTPRAVRVARALAMLGAGLSALGCGSADDAGAASEGPPAGDAASEASAIDLDATDELPSHACQSWNLESVPCGDGGVCQVIEATGGYECVAAGVGDAGADATACGDLACGYDCVCRSAASSTCVCVNGIGGPLPPPDLPEPAGA